MPRFVKRPSLATEVQHYHGRRSVSVAAALVTLTGGGEAAFARGVIGHPETWSYGPNVLGC